MFARGRPILSAAAAALAVALALPASGAARAQGAQGSAGVDGPQNLPGQAATSDQPPSPPTAELPSVETSLGPYGDPGGYRAYLKTRGIIYSLTYIGETLGNASGGQRRGAIYEGRLDGQLDVDLDTLAGLKGLAFHTNFYQIHGHGLSRYYLGNLNTASGIEAVASTKLYELWLEQKVLDDKLGIRFGQLAADTEFLISQYGGLFVNATYGFPAITANDLPNGGPAYPLATPAVRLKWSPTDELTILAAVFNGDPAGNGPGDPQRNARGGVEFRAVDPPLLIAEAAYSYKLGRGDEALPGTVKFGGWRHAGRFDDLRYAAPAPGATAFLLADPGSSGIARRFRGNSGIYGVVDQLVYRTPGTADGGLGLFLRASTSPGDRNLVDFYVDGGLTYKGLVPGRPDDTLGVAGAYVQIGRGARGLDRDTALFNPDAFSPIRSSEAQIEVTYQAQVVPGFTVQPDVQYVFRPGATVVNPYSPAGAVAKDAIVAGLRATIRY